MQQFGPAMMKKYNLQIYRPKYEKNEPVIFFGCYSHGAKAWILNHKGLVVIVWSGSDSTRLHEVPEFVAYCIRNKHRVFHIAHSHWIQTDLKEFGLEWIDKVVLPQDFSEFKFSPTQGKNVYHYGSSGNRLFYYGTPLIKKLRDEWKKKDLPGFYITAPHSYSRKQIIKMYEDSFIGVRLTEHDNMALSCIEMGLMGRYSIFNGNIPCAIPYPNKPYDHYNIKTRTSWVLTDDSVMDFVKPKILEYRYTPPSETLAAEMREFIHDDKKWLDTSFYD